MRAAARSIKIEYCFFDKLGHNEKLIVPFVHKFIKLVGISCVTAEMCEKIHELLTELRKKCHVNASGF